MAEKLGTTKKIHHVSDGFGNEWQCRHQLSPEFCCMEVVRPGKCQCVCDGGLEDLLDHTYKRGMNDE